MPQPSEVRKTKDLRDAEEEKAAANGKQPTGAEKPGDPRKRDGEAGRSTAPDGDRSDSAHDDSPPWLVSLPEEYRRMITGGDMEKVPQEYRHLVEAYQRWLADHAKGGTGR